MGDNRSSRDLDIADLEELLWQRKNRPLAQRRRHLLAMGRVVTAPGLEPPGHVPRGSGSNGDRRAPAQLDGASAELSPVDPRRQPIWRRLGDRILLLLEIALVVFFLATITSLWLTNNALNRKLGEAQRAAGAALALPTPSPRPAIDVVILPGGHRPPVAGATPQPGEAGYVPAHLLPAISNFESPPVPTPAPEHARRIEIAATGVDSAIYQGMYDWEVLKKGVAQYIGSAAPGEVGNMVLAGHNDVYGEVFRDLDRLAPGDKIVVSSERQAYTYVVRETVIVDPTEVWVLAPTAHASLSLISCYPYRVNTKRIVVFADLVS